MRQQAQLQALLEPAINVLGYELVGVEYLRQGRQGLLRIYIDSEDGITVDDCGRVSHQVSGILDVEDPIREQYMLEVSSPGLDKAIVYRGAFPEIYRAYGKGAYENACRRARNFKGTLKGVEDGNILVEAEEQEVSLPLSDIEKANLVPEF